ncbi:GNAT family N-acetyltransferase [Aquisediminimonas profunda]|uniref:GNAT family N-acetyltransferase n=1 Tax=Aquisediminimonas profunda TaxID=1550733 RepID=UPI001C62A734|nr:GNAT family N-acetyltransferase [Aquisediminimonas profunda]
MHIRCAEAADVSAIIAVDLSAGCLFEGTHMAWAVGETSSPEELRELIAQELVWVAVIDGEIAGYICGNALARDFHIEEVAVASGFQRRGVGKDLIAHMTNIARRLGLEALTLTTDRTLPWNAPYYERLGFSFMADGDIPPYLRNALAEKPDPERRCAMIRRI